MSPVPFADRLIEASRRRGTVLCIGLDPFPDLIPTLFGPRTDPLAALTRFTQAAVEALADLPAAVKPQLGLFEAYGPDGYALCRYICETLTAHDTLVILDAKRGDIGTTAEGYARASLGRQPGFDADAVTVNAYMGLDTLRPFLNIARAHSKGVAVLVRTSNPGAVDFQDLKVDGRPLWTHVAQALCPLSTELLGASGWSGLMVVAGATYPEEARALRAMLPRNLFLVPGYGAQGAGAAAALAGFVPGPKGLEGGVVSSSRAILYPPAAQAAGNLADWRAAVRAAAQAAIADLRAAE
jgi:orotidine-5'-phosphate decarboxylase